MIDLPETVYAPESPLRHPLRLFARMFRDLGASRELAWRLFIRDLSAQYRQSFFGYIWAFIPPLVVSLPFIFLNSQGVISVKGTSLPYPAYVMIGTIIWQVFVDALNSPLKTVVASKAMLARINFPREAILLAALGQILFTCLIRLLLLAGVFVYFNITPPITALLFPFGVLALIGIGFMLGLAVTPLGLLYSDVQQAIPIFAMFLMFLTPVLYPAPQSGIAGMVARWNPLTPLVTVTRDWLTGGDASALGAFALVAGVTGCLLFLCWTGYRIALPHIIARMGN